MPRCARATLPPAPARSVHPRARERPARWRDGRGGPRCLAGRTARPVKRIRGKLVVAPTRCSGWTRSRTTSKKEERMKTPTIVSPEEWKAAREELLVEEKAVTRARDALAAKRRRMPWMAVEKDYRFEGPNGPASLAELFEGRRQLVVYRAFYAPDVTTYPRGGGAYPERACVGCSLVADQVAHPAHLNARDTTLAYVSRAPQAEIQGLKERMGWELIPWYTLTDDFDKDFGVDEWHGHNAFIREGDRIFRTYFIDARGDEHIGTTWSYLDTRALGRKEEGGAPPEGYPQAPPYQWWNYHDAYGEDA